MIKKDTDFDERKREREYKISSSLFSLFCSKILFITIKERKREKERWWWQLKVADKEEKSSIIQFFREEDNFLFIASFFLFFLVIISLFHKMSIYLKIYLAFIIAFSLSHFCSVIIPYANKQQLIALFCRIISATILPKKHWTWFWEAQHLYTCFMARKIVSTNNEKNIVACT